jgi:hypothetical protein
MIGRGLIPSHIQQRVIPNFTTGTLVWTNGFRDGCKVGNRKGRYMQLMFEGQSYYIHRVLWFLFYGEQPPLYIDHIDQDPSNNAISNLQEATHTQNSYNRKCRAPLGVKGVQQLGDKFKVQLVINGVNTYYGMFSTLHEARILSETLQREHRGAFVSL